MILRAYEQEALMARESMKSKRARALAVCERMGEHYPHAQPALDFGGDPFRLTIAVLLSAQTTDAAVNKVTPVLWERYPTIEDLAAANVEDISEILHSIGFFRTKAANCVKCAQMVLSEFGGEVPRTYEELQRLPGVGRKTANIVMNAGFGIVEGIAVDTHVFRIAHKLKLSNAKDPSKTEEDLLKLIPQELWEPVNHQWILFGREICNAKRPKCAECFLADLCPSCE
jgi:endonuclease-3